MNLSKHTLKAMGFQPISHSDHIIGVFYSLHVYEIRGRTLDAGALDPRTGCIKGTSYRVAVGSRINEICQRLAGDNCKRGKSVGASVHQASLICDLT